MVTPFLRFPLALLGFLSLLAVTACQYPPPDDAQVPGPSSAYIPPVESDVDIEGYHAIQIAYENPNDGGEYECLLWEYIEGWRRDDIDDNSCQNCERYYKIDAWLVPGEQGDTCGLADAFPWMSVEGRNGRMGITPISDAPNDYQWLANYGVSDILYGNWSPAGIAGGNDYSFYLYAYPSADALDGDPYRSGEWVWYGYYYYTIDGSAVGEDTLYASGYATLGAYQ